MKRKMITVHWKSNRRKIFVPGLAVFVGASLSLVVPFMVLFVESWGERSSSSFMLGLQSPPPL